MRCPHCGEEIQGPVCPQCQAMAPEGATYCMECGSALEDPEETPVSDEIDDGLDLDNRILCPDGTCTGIIVDGKCVECGTIFKET